MLFFALEPEVAGRLGDNTIADRSKHSLVIQRLHYEFDGWLGDDLLESFPAFIVTQSLADQLTASTLTGHVLDDVEVSKSDLFEEIHPDRDLPKFYWLKIVGRAGTDDFGLSPDHRIVVSQPALELLKSMKLNNCEAEKYA